MLNMDSTLIVVLPTTSLQTFNPFKIMITFTTEEEEIIRRVYSILLESTEVKKPTRSFIKHLDKYYFGLCELFSAYHKSFITSYLKDKLYEVYKEQGGKKPDFSYWFDIRENMLAYRINFLERVLQDYCRNTII